MNKIKCRKLSAINRSVPITEWTIVISIFEEPFLSSDKLGLTQVQSLYSLIQNIYPIHVSKDKVK